MQFLVTLVQLSFLLRVIWQNVEGLAKKPTSGTLDTIWEVTGTKLPVLPVPPGHPVSKQNADVTSLTCSCSLMASIIITMIGGLMWMGSASSTSLSSSVVFPGAPDLMVFLEFSLAALSSSSSLLSVEGARVLGFKGGCLSIGPTFPAVCTSSSNISQQ